MIIDNITKTDIQTIGDVKQIKASIDVENLSFITVLLSSNLYSNPVGSFLREIVSNAWDSHVAANNTNEPVIIKINEDSITIRDYGTGLSKEEFEDLYCKIGSSTKRNSNKYIGYFGLGHLSPLAVSDVVDINSYYNGKMSKYIMVKDNGNIVTNFISEKDTTEKNGLSITVKKKNIWRKAKEELQYLTFFPNIYVDYADIAKPSIYEDINKAIIKRFKYFSVTNTLQEIAASNSYYYQEKLYGLLGNVLYPIDDNYIKYDSDELEKFLKIIPCLNFNIGEINVTPNRESIIYSESTINIINERFKNAINEFKEFVATKIPENIDNIKEYYNYISNDSYYYIIEDKISNERNQGSYNLDRIIPKYKGILRGEEFDKILKTAMRSVVPKLRATIQNSYNKVTVKKSNSHYGSQYSLIGKTSLITIDYKFTNLVRDYIFKNTLSGNYHVCSPVTLKEFTNHYITENYYLRTSYVSHKDDQDLIYTDLYNDVYLTSIKYTISEEDIKNYSKERREERKLINKGVVVDDKEYAVYKFYESNFYNYSESYKRRFTISQFIQTLKLSKKCILCKGCKGEDYKYNVENSLKVCDFGYTIFAVSKTMWDKINDYKIHNPSKLTNVFMDIDYIVSHRFKSEEFQMAMSQFNQLDPSFIRYIYEKLRPRYKELLKNYFVLRMKRKCDISGQCFIPNYNYTTPECIFLNSIYKKLVEIDSIKYNIPTNDCFKYNVSINNYFFALVISKTPYAKYFNTIEDIKNGKNNPIIKFMYEYIA